MSGAHSELKNAGLKVTGPRVRVLEHLETTRDRHLSAEDIWSALKEHGDEASLATVYRVLTQFEAAGLVQRHTFEGNTSVFELADEEHHDHMVCTKCGSVTEYVDEIIERRQHEIADAHGFEVSDHVHVIYGLCRQCH
ncbi:ferric iron uptake transcriptional regulator [Litorivicinus lipolyticus]|uniref:Ferric uptake regulation protein n=1 Tax=Litorivicinus lipolyticus TaxID=418701 RepID=A0A5Q2Q7Q5_9GAMM|nr:ferric iron uptake transcriptional regulator [Litorivicinus lipolyticus]QGG80569.1 ferric iron uptake transcriptional regulator [Litorivicinus lipolyticus]